MLFNSWVFYLFAPIVLALYYILPFRAQNLMLLVASYVFYGWWDPRFLLLLVASSLIDYAMARTLDESDDPVVRKRCLLVSMVGNLSMLCFFKYFDFFVGSMEELLRSIGIKAELMRLNVVLPVGISFYTFQTMAYTIDVYWKRIKPEKDIFNFLLFVSYFPQLVAGPIERASNLLPQLTRPRTVTRRMIVDGIWFIVLGMFKKVVVADNLVLFVDEAFNASKTPSGLVCLLSVYAFTIQAYCDFAGYSDIARGVSRLMGVELMLNFDMPLIARNPSEFWRRWHISLSFWFRDYVYIPLGGSRKGAWRTYFNLTLTFVLSGLWHGATWTWINWGLYNGVITSVHRYFFVQRTLFKIESRWADIVARILYYQVTCLGFLTLRAQDMHTVWRFLKSIFTDMYVDLAAAPVLFSLLTLGGFLAAVDAWMRNRDQPSRAWGWNYGLGLAVVTLMLLGMFLFAPPEGQPFIYFQF